VTSGVGVPGGAVSAGAAVPALQHQLLDVVSGEVLPASVDNAARVLEAAREMKRRLNIVVAEATSFLLEQSQQRGTKTFRSDHGMVTLAGGPATEYDAYDLATGLRAAGCPEDRVEECVQAEITYKVNRSVAKQLAAANPKYRAAVAAAERQVEKPYRASVKP
jgi:hypothetical protein